MKWKSIKLEDLICKPISGEWGKQITNKQDENIVKVIRTANFTNKGVVDYEDIVLRNIDTKKVKQKKLLYGDILVEKSGGTDKYPVGRVVFYDKNDEIYLSNNFTTIFRVKKDKIYNRFLFYYLFYNYNRGGMIKYYNKTTGIQNLKVNHLIKELQIPVPPLNIQKQIVEILDEAQKLIDNRKKEIKLFDDLIESIFYDMFGDPVKNDKGWEVRKLGDSTEIITGNTPSRKNQENYGNYIEWIKSDNINTPYMYLTEAEEYLSEKGKEIGRTADNGSILMTCIAGSIKCIGNVAIADRKVAFNQQINAIIPLKYKLYFLYVLFITTKEYIQNNSTSSMKGMISKGNLSKLEFIIPPLQLQNQFAEKVQTIEKQKALLEESLKLMEDNYKSLMQRAFKGELF
ncbi:restriction endonuclease subunit S [Clostridiisalibacter paucivorans]|uniref:restriction endonuclease subunit S n=1 Tax=Clostridiisalibacter paucivorans TaxID=408753 RepID=UPI000683FE41|nr:restriction endonuclease subunit S [Clostridiisalibacter paucivorans]